MPNFIKIGKTFAEIWRFNGFFSKWRPSAILDLSGAYFGTTHEDYLVVFIVMLNLAGIAAVLSII